MKKSQKEKNRRGLKIRAMADIVNPHDKFFKEVLSREEIAREFMIHYLPSDVVDLFDMTSLEIKKDSFIEKGLKEYFSDLLYRVDTKDGDASYVYVLFEHKSYPERLISLHLLRYMVRIWEQAVKLGESKPLPPVIPVVVYHGRSKWKVGLDFHDLFDIPELQHYLPDFRYLLCDLTQYSDEEMRGAVTLKAAFLLMKHIFSEDLADRLPGILALLRDLLNKRSGLEYLETLLRYVASGSDQIREEEIERGVKEILREKGGHIMPTLAEQWIEQGIQQGIQQGVQQGILETSRTAVIEVLEERFETVSQTLRNRLKAITDPDILKSLHKKALNAGSLEEFTAEVKAALA